MTKNNFLQSNGKSPHNGRSTTIAVNSLLPKRSVIIAYIVWFFGGFFGLHHIYLRRDRHALVCWYTFGGFFGLGWLHDFFYMPSYVRDANEDPKFIQEFVKKLQCYRKPPYSSKRFMSEVVVGCFFGHLYKMAIPQNNVMGIDFTLLHWIIPVAISLGVWTVGNIGRERGVLWHCLLSAFAAYPLRYYIYDESWLFILTSLASALTFDHISKEWLRTPPKKQSKLKRTLNFTVALCIYFSLWGSFLMFNGTISDSNGNEVPIYNALQNFLASAWWTDMKQALKDLYNYACYHGWYEILKEIIESIDVDGERNAYKVLGVGITASQSEIKAAYRKLSKEYHPDKVKDESKKEETNQRFIEIQQAYNVLSNIKTSRRRKNTKSVEDTPIVE